jgi:hypothetical protein
MRTVSFDKAALNITVHNLYAGLGLASPVYFSNDKICHVFPNHQTDTGTITEASFGIDSKNIYFKGALLYKLWRKCATKTDNQPNSSTASIEDTTTNIYLLVSWNYYHYYKFYACLIECTDDFTWDEDKLWTLYKEYHEQFHKDYKPIVNTWLIYDGAVMKMKFNITYGSNYKFNIVISEETRKYNVKDPIPIDPKRLVLSLLMLIVLMYTVRLPIPRSVKLNIHNQCLNVDLISPAYATSDGLECHRAPAYKVCAGDIMKSAFIINKSNHVSYGVLIYRLQRKQAHESTETSEDTSSISRLLVFWVISKFNELYADVLLVEHAKEFVWNEDDLRELYDKNYHQLKEYDDIIPATWLMDDHMILKTSFKTENLEENFDLSISIYEEEKYDCAMRPIRISTKR